MEARSRGPVQRVPLSEVRTAVISPVISPLQTVMALTAAALSDRGGPGAPLPVMRALAPHLRARDVAVLLPLRACDRPDGSGGRPNEIVPLSHGASIDEELQAVRAVAPEKLSAGIVAANNAGHPAAGWRHVERDAARWLPAYVDALRRAWSALEPIWTRSSAMIDREVERVSVALARGAGAELIAQLYPAGAIVDDELLLPSHSGRSGRIRVGESLLLHPLIASSPGSGWTDDYGCVCLAVRYSVPQVWHTFDGQPPPLASLSALLGTQRARILRSLDRPATAGELATSVQGAPSMLTHHLAALERAGLITRTRKGRHVWVGRSARGTELAAMYERA